MHAKTKTLLRVLFMTLLFASSALARAQEPPKPQAPARPYRARVDRGGPQKLEGPAEGQREARESAQPDRQPDATLDPEVERINREMDRQLIWTKQQLLREALDRVREGSSHKYRWLLGDLGAFLIFLTILGSLLWILRTILDTKRWNKIAKVQTEAHTKLLEKFGSSQELLTYMQTEAGRRFLESAPFEIEHKPSAAFPFGRILWSAQVGIILALAGAGLLALRGQLADVTEPLLVFGTLAATIGVGFILSAGFSYALSKHFGLLEGLRRSGDQGSPSPAAPGRQP